MQTAGPEDAVKNGEAANMRSIEPRRGPGLSKGFNGAAGQMAPQPEPGDKTRLDDRVGYNHAALVRSEFAARLAKKYTDSAFRVETNNAETSFPLRIGGGQKDESYDGSLDQDVRNYSQCQ